MHDLLTKTGILSSKETILGKNVSIIKRLTIKQI